MDAKGFGIESGEFGDELRKGKLSRRQAIKMLASVGVGVAVMPLLPTGVSAVTIELGTLPFLAMLDVFDQIRISPSSPSGLDVTATPGIITDTAFPEVSARPRSAVLVGMIVLAMLIGAGVKKSWQFCGTKRPSRLILILI